jgi:hypothetical protein
MASISIVQQAVDNINNTYEQTVSSNQQPTEANATDEDIHPAAASVDAKNNVEDYVDKIFAEGDGNKPNDY